MALFKKNPQRQAEEAFKLYQQGMAAAQQNDFTRCIPAFEKAIEIQTEIGHTEGEMVCRYQLGDVYIKTENLPRAKMHLQKALTLAGQLGKDVEKGDINFMLGRVMRFSGQPDQSIPYFEESIRLCRANRDNERLPSVMNNLGLAYRHTHNTTQAQRTYEEALAIPEIKDNPGMAGVIHNNLAMTYWDMGDSKQTLSHLKQALPLRRQARDIHGVAETLNNLVQICQQTGDEAGAQQYSQELQRMI
jgi:tetratricopeptide (TPR) repeat protein